ncbi:MAG: cysteine desulfurase family protein [Candidatus Zixiibacteriota bacterium]
MKRIYFDHNSTTPLDPRVLEAMMPYLSSTYGNASSVHSIGQFARAGLEQSREKLAALLGCRPDELYFTSGATESDNIAIKGVADALAHKGRHIITTKTEHQAVLEPCKFLEKHDYEVTYLDVDGLGHVDTEQLRAAIRPDTILVSVIYVNNETGTLQNIGALAQIAHEKNVYFHTDAVQAIGKMKVDLHTLGVEMGSGTAHKFYGPKGVGFLFAKVGTRFSPHIHGGAHERGKRAGTENVPGVVGMARALELSMAELESNSAHVAKLADRLTSGILETIPESRLHGDPKNGIQGTMFFTFPGADGEAIILSLDMAGIAVSSGSACTSGATEPSHVLLAMGVSAQEASSAIRFSLGKDNTIEEIDFAIATLPAIVERLRKMSPQYAGR